MRRFVAQLHRATKLGMLTLMLGTGTGHVAGCIYPDYCIQIGIAGTQTCLGFTNATGTTAEGEVVSLSDDFNIVEGCKCLRDGEVDILMSGDPDMPGYEELYEELRSAARLACLERALEQGMVDSNCLDAEIEGLLDLQQEHACTAGCVYSNPPPNRPCPECVLGDDDASGESGAFTTSTDESDGGDDPPVRVQLFHGGMP